MFIGYGHVSCKQAAHSKNINKDDNTQDKY